MSQLFKNFTQHLTNPDNGGTTVFLTNGVKLSGVITWADDVCLTLARDGITQLVMVQAIATIMPQDAFHIDDIMGEQE